MDLEPFILELYIFLYFPELNNSQRHFIKLNNSQYLNIWQTSLVLQIFIVWWN